MRFSHTPHLLGIAALVFLAASVCVGCSSGVETKKTSDPAQVEQMRKQYEDISKRELQSAQRPAN